MAIGRNEGERLRVCLRSCLAEVPTVVYVDSGSTDDSVALARSLGAHVVELDPALPFTAARARNLGLKEVRRKAPEVELVQFVDGDCELVGGWLARARSRLDADESLAVVCGRRRERFPDNTVYNRLCDIEWNTPIGPARASGGDALMRVFALESVGGFREEVVAGEEPELCYRLRQHGWTVERLDAEMTIHDANMTSFRQWWKRTERGGHAFAEQAWLHGAEGERLGVRNTVSSFAWFSASMATLLMPILLPAWMTLASATGARVYRHMRHRGFAQGDSALFAAHCVMGKIPEAVGAGRLVYRRVANKERTLLEYK